MLALLPASCGCGDGAGGCGGGASCVEDPTQGDTYTEVARQERSAARILEQQFAVRFRSSIAVVSLNPANIL